jgi:hypothetical protein
MQFVGIDLHTNRFTCCYLYDKPDRKRAEECPLTYPQYGVCPTAPAKSLLLSQYCRNLLISLRIKSGDLR